MGKGIKETEDVLKLVEKAGVLIASRVKDGVDFDDALFIFSQMVMEPELKAVLAQAVEGIKEVIPEMQDLKFMEGLSLVRNVAGISKNILAALKK